MRSRPLSADVSSAYQEYVQRLVHFAALLSCSACVKGSVSLPEPDATSGRDSSVSTPETGVLDTGEIQDATPRDFGPTHPDAGPTDVPIHDSGANECSRAADCTGHFTPGSVPFCDHPDWSCIDGRCTYECSSGGRTCSTQSDGCVLCDDGSHTCRDSACVFNLETAEFEHSYCARAYLPDVVACFGLWAQLSDGTICTLTPVASGLERAVLTCDFCQTQLVWQ